MTPSEQASHIERSDIIVAPSGAALANIIFARPGTRIVVYGTSDISLWQSLGAALELDVRAIILPIPNLGANSPPYILSEAQIRKIVAHAT